MTYDAAAAAVVDVVLAAAPTLGAGRLLCVDGPSGSGKSALAAELDHALHQAGSRVGMLHMDDVYDGWAGLDAGMATVARDVVAPLRSGRPGRYRRFDWHAMVFAEERLVAPCDVLVVEGVGSGGLAVADAVTVLVWVDCPDDVRLARGIARDGEGMRSRLLAWHRQEEAMFARERTRERADLVVDGQTGTVRK